MSTPTIDLAAKFAPQCDELFKTESKISLLTNSDYDWTGAHSVKILKATTASMNDYARNIFSAEGVTSASRYGDLLDLSAEAEELILSRDRSFIFNVDKMDVDETNRAIEAASALARQLREVVIPEIDTYVYAAMATNAGTKPEAAELTAANIYGKILAGSEALDDAEVPETGRVLILAPSTYSLLKQATVFDNSPVGDELKTLGVVGILDGMAVVKVPAVRLPEGFGFMIAHPSATVAPVKLEDYGTHDDTALSSGTVVTGRIVYDAFVLDNKVKGIYYQACEPTGATGATGETGGEG